MSDEDALLAAVAADPAAALPRLVYADWLDDHGRAAEAELVRLEQHLAAAPGDDAALVRFRDLAAGRHPAWLAKFVRPEVARCGVRFAYACPKRWADMAITGDPAVRHCDGCAQPVHLSTSRVQAWQHAMAGRCVAVDRRLVDPSELPASFDLITAGIPADVNSDPVSGDVDYLSVGSLTWPGPPADQPPVGIWDRLRRLFGRP